MNASRSALVRMLLGRLRETLGDLGWQFELEARTGSDGPGEFDALLRLRPRAGKPALLLVACKRDMRPAAFQQVAQRLRTVVDRQRATPLLGLPSVSPRLAALCREAGWGWFDLAGNCRIEVAGVVHVERSGLPPVRPTGRRGATLASTAAARVLRVLLSPAHAGRAWKQRDLRERTGSGLSGDPPVSLGLVNKLVRHLGDQGFVEPAGNDGLRVRDPVGLLAAWRDAYRFDRHDRHDCFTLLKAQALDAGLWRVAAGAPDAVVYAAFSAAERQAPHVRQSRTWVYARPERLDGLLRETAARKVDSGENLVVLVPEDPGVFQAFDSPVAGGKSPGCTDPVQTWVDLFHCGGRGEEAAQAVLEQCILPAWKATGLA